MSAAESVTLVVIDDGVGMTEERIPAEGSGCATFASERRSWVAASSSRMSSRMARRFVGSCRASQSEPGQWSVLALTAKTAASVRLVMPSFIKIDDM